VQVLFLKIEYTQKLSLILRLIHQPCNAPSPAATNELCMTCTSTEMNITFSAYTKSDADDSSSMSQITGSPARVVVSHIPAQALP